jgi:hypothetical protein
MFISRAVFTVEFTVLTPGLITVCIFNSRAVFTVEFPV